MKVFGKFTSPLPVLAVVAALLAGCERPPDLIGVDNPAIPADVRPGPDPPPDLHRNDPRSLRGDRRVLLVRPRAGRGPRLRRGHDPAEPRPRRARAAHPSSPRSQDRVHGHRSRRLQRRHGLHRGGQAGARQAARGAATAAPLRSRLQQHGQRRDPADGAVRRGHGLRGRAGALHLGVGRKRLALRLRPQQRSRRARQDQGRHQHPGPHRARKAWSSSRIPWAPS